MTTTISDSYQGTVHDSSDASSISGLLSLDTRSAEQKVQSSGPWPLAHTLALALLASGVLWGLIAVIVHYFW